MPSDLFSFSVIILAVYHGLSLDMFARWDASPPLYTVFLSRFWASTLPKWGKHVTQQGQARCPTWAHFLLLPCPISHFFITPISSYFFPFPRQRNLPNLPSLPITFHPIIPHPLPSSSAVIKLYEILQTASGQLPDTFPSNTPGPASRQWVDNPKSVIRACLYFGILEEWILFVF